MADISAEIAAFQNAVYGEDVRSALVTLASTLNDAVTIPSNLLYMYYTVQDTVGNDLNNANRIGYYIVSASDNTANVPINKNGFVLNLPLTPTITWQVYFRPGTAEYYTRSKNTTWSEWIFSGDLISDAIDELNIEDTFKTFKKIDSDTNFNDIGTYNGFYFVHANPNYESVNMPISQQGILLNFKMTALIYFQVFIRYGSNPIEIYTRYCNSSGEWSVWRKLHDDIYTYINYLLDPNYLVNGTWVYGSMNGTTGADLNTDKVIRTTLSNIPANTTLTVNEGYCIACAEYDINSGNLLKIRGRTASVGKNTYTTENNANLKVVVSLDVPEVIDNIELFLFDSGIKRVRQKYSDDEIDIRTITTNNIFDKNDCAIEKASIAVSSLALNYNDRYRTAVIPVTYGNKYIVSCQKAANFRVGLSEDYPSSTNGCFTQLMGTSEYRVATMIPTQNEVYMSIYFYITGSESNQYSYEEVLDDITVFIDNAPHRSTLHKEIVDGVVNNIIKDSIDSEYGAPKFYLHDPTYEGAWYSSLFQNTLRSNTRNDVTTDMIYELYDALQQENPYYIDEAVTIGYSIDENGDQHKPIKAYRFHPREWKWNNAAKTSRHDIEYDPNMPTWLITTGIHGREAGSILTVYTLFYRMFHGGSMYGHLRKNAVYWVIPCACPWGVDNTSRYLAASVTMGLEDPDLVDPNRQTQYPLSEHPIPNYAPEIQAIVNFAETIHLGDNPLNVYVDSHNCSGIQGYLGSDRDYDRYMFLDMLTELTHAWRCNRQDAYGNPVIYYGEDDTQTEYITGIPAKKAGNSPKTLRAYFGLQYPNLRHVDLIETLSTDSIIDGSDSGAYYSPRALAFALDMTYHWFDILWEDNQRCLTSRIFIDGSGQTIVNGTKLLSEEPRHSDTYRGKLLGSGATFEAASTEAQRAAIADGTFKDMFIGDYWIINSIIYRIADFNYWLNTGDTLLITNHLLLVPDTYLSQGVMNQTDIVTNAYYGSYLRSDNSGALKTAISTINSVFGSYLLTHRNYLPRNFASDTTNAGIWDNSTVELMNELMVYGNFIHSKSKWVDEGQISTVDKTQLALFRLNPGSINAGYNYWLRDVATTTQFSAVLSSGLTGFLNASSTAKVRPVFAIKGTTT